MEGIKELEISFSSGIMLGYSAPTFGGKATDAEAAHVLT